MAKLPGLYRRGPAGTFQLRVVIPLDLRPQYAGRSKLIEALGTADEREASRIGAARRALRLTEFEEKRRQGSPQRIESISPDMARLLAERVKARILGTDESIRGSTDAARLLMAAARPARVSALRIGGGELVPVQREVAAVHGGLDDALMDELASVNAAVHTLAGRQLAGQRIGAVLPLVQAEALALGVTFDEAAPGATEALRGALKAARTAWQDVRRRDAGEVVETPEAPLLAVPAAPTTRALRLRDVLPQWTASRERKPATVKGAEKSLAMYEELTGDPPLAELTRAQGVAFRAALLAMDTTSKTASDRLDSVKAFLNFAHRELELIPRNPWAGLSIVVKTERPGRAWSTEQLQRLLSSPVFTSYAIPAASHAGGDAAYWIPLLGLYTGARISELAQLRTVDMEVAEGVPVLHITDEAEGQSVKTEAGRRTVPLHSELVRLGFVEYVEAIRMIGAASMFPALPLLVGKPGNYFSDWFREALVPQPDGTRLPRFHELRHTVRTRLTAGGGDAALVKALIGHEQTGTSDRVYLHPDVAMLWETMERLRYAGIELPRVYVAPVKVGRIRRRVRSNR